MVSNRYNPFFQLLSVLAQGAHIGQISNVVDTIAVSKSEVSLF